MSGTRLLKGGMSGEHRDADHPEGGDAVNAGRIYHRLLVDAGLIDNWLSVRILHLYGRGVLPVHDVPEGVRVLRQLGLMVTARELAAVAWRGRRGAVRRREE